MSLDSKDTWGSLGTLLELASYPSATSPENGIVHSKQVGLELASTPHYIAWGYSKGGYRSNSYSVG